MIIRPSTVGLVLLLVASTVRAGGTIASPAIFAGPDQTEAGCAIRNVGAKPVLVDASIFDESGTALSGFGSCADGPLAPGDECSMSALISTGVAYACSATVRSGSPKSVRGVLLVTPSHPLRHADLR